MRLVLMIILALLGSSALVLLLKLDSGYALLRVGGYSLETSLAVLMVVLIVFVCLCYLVVRLMLRSWAAPKQILRYSRDSRYKKAQLDMQMGLADLSVGKWRTAERRLMRRADHCDNPVIGYIGAAKAAEQLGANSRRDDYLKRALEISPDAALAIGLSQADMLMEKQQYANALVGLTELRHQNPESTLVLQRLFNAYFEVKDWRALTPLVAEVTRLKVLPPESINVKADIIFAERFKQLQAGTAGANESSEQTVEGVWRLAPAAQKQNSQVKVEYAAALQMQGNEKQAISVIESELRKSWNAALAGQYAWLSHDNPTKALKHVEAWMKQHGERPELLYCAGRLCIQAELWGKAKALLEQCVASAPSADAWQALGLLAEKTDQPEQALTAYRNAGMANRPIPAASSALALDTPETNAKAEDKAAAPPEA